MNQYVYPRHVNQIACQLKDLERKQDSKSVVQTLLQKLLAKGVLAQTDLAACEKAHTCSSIKGWEHLLSLMKREPQASLECLASVLDGEDLLVRDILAKLAKLWISGEAKVAIFITALEYEYISIHSIAATKQSIVLQRDGLNELQSTFQHNNFKVKVLNFTTEGLDANFRSLAYSMREDAAVFLCITGVMSANQGTGSALLVNPQQSLIYWPPSCPQQLNGISIEHLVKLVNTFPTSNITFFVNCIQFQNPQNWNPWCSIFNGLKKSCGLVVQYLYNLEACLHSKANPFQTIPLESSFSWIQFVLSQVLSEWIEQKIVDVSHRNLYDAVTYKLDFIESPSAGWPFRLYIQGDTERRLFGMECIPSVPFCVSSPVRLQPNDALAEVVVSTNNAFEIARDSPVSVHHVLLPGYTKEGKIIKQMGKFFCKVAIKLDNEDALRNLIVELQGKRRLNATFLLVCLRPKEPLKVVFSKEAVNQRLSDVTLLKQFINGSIYLSYEDQETESSDNSCISRGVNVTYDDQYERFTIRKPLLGRFMSITESNVEVLKSVLMKMAVHQLGHCITQPLQSSYKFKCFVLEEKELLKRENAYPLGPIIVSASSEKNDHSGAIQSIPNAEQKEFWKPVTATKDEYLMYEFPRNHYISQMEMKGDPESIEYVKMFKLEYSSFVEDPMNFRITRDALTVSKRMLSEAALLCFIELHITNWTRCAQLKVTFLFQHGEPKVRVFCQQNISIQPQEAKLKAVILEEGTVIITPASSTSPMKVVFHFEEAVVIKTVSLSGMPEGTSEEVDVAGEILFISPVGELELEGNKSIWPKRLSLPAPILGQRFKIVPTQFTEKGIALQLQLFGSQATNPLVVTDGTILQMHYKLEQASQPINIYVLLFEYTGTVSLMYQGRLTPDNPTLMSHLEVFISKDLPDYVDEITDTYRIVTSTKSLDLDVFQQWGPSECRQNLYYSFKNRVHGYHNQYIDDKEWNVTEIQVIIRKKR